MFEEHDEIVTVDEACDMLKMGRGAVYGLLSNGQLKGIRNGRVWRVPKVAVIEFICNSSGVKIR